MYKSNQTDPTIQESRPMKVSLQTHILLLEYTRIVLLLYVSPVASFSLLDTFYVLDEHYVLLDIALRLNATIVNNSAAQQNYIIRHIHTHTETHRSPCT